MEVNADALRDEIKKAMMAQGFLINPHLRPTAIDKSTIREIHKKKRQELIKAHRKVLCKGFNEAKRFSVNGKDLCPDKIDLELIEVKSGSIYSRLFLWWNLIWWSLPFDRPIGRQIRFILWDRYHNAPFGLVGLQSPPLHSVVRDQYLRLKSNQSSYSYWLNQSMYAQRVGALPPYNELLGAKMAALTLTCNEVRECYRHKYEKKTTLLNKRTLPSELFFITTTSAYGKSIIYEHLSYKGFPVSRFIGFTAGSGTFHVPEELYEKLLLYLWEEGVDVRRGFGTGPSRKLGLITCAFKKIGVGNFTSHNVKRGHYIFENVSNLKDVIHRKESPLWHDRPFNNLFSFWKEEFCLPRSERVVAWRQFDRDNYFEITQALLGS